MGSSDELLKMLHLFCVTQAIDMRSPERLKASPQYKHFKKEAPAVLTHLRSFCDSRVEMSTMLLLAFGDMKDTMGIPTNAGTLMSRIHMVPSVIDNMFPGYRQAGLLPIAGKQTGKRP